MSSNEQMIFRNEVFIFFFSFYPLLKPAGPPRFSMIEPKVLGKIDIEKNFNPISPMR